MPAQFRAEKDSVNNNRPLNRWDWIRYGPFLAQIVVTRRCNLSCAYCSEYDKTSAPIPFQDLTTRFNKLRELKTWAVCLTGGEPTLHPQLPKLVANLKSLGIRRRLIITNGYLLNRRLIEALNESGLTDLQISIDGINPTETTVKTLNPLRKKLSLLSKHACFKVMISGVIGSAPPSEALEVVKFAKSNGFIPRILLIHDEKGQLDLNEEELNTYREVKKMIKSRFEDADEYRENLIQKGVSPFNCRAGSRYLYVDEFGKVHWCYHTLNAFSKDLLDYSLQDLKDQFYTHKACNETCTLGCVRTASVYDQWRKQIDK